MKRFLALFSFLCMFCCCFSTEVNDSTKVEEKHRFNTYVYIESSVSPRQNGLIPSFYFTTIEVEPIKKLTVGFSYSGFLGLYKDKTTKTYMTAQGLAGCVGWQIFESKKKTSFWDKGESINARFRYGHNIGSGDFKYDLYDIGFVYFAKNRTIVGTSFSAGYRFINSHTTGIRNYSSIYLGIGIGI